MRKHSITKSSNALGSIRTSIRTWRCFCFAILLFLSGWSVQAQCTLSCNGSYTTSLNQFGEALISANSLLNDPGCDANDFTVTITWNGNNIGNILNCIHIGYTLEAKVTHNISGNYCLSNVQVMDYIAPQISCTDTIIPCNSAATPEEAGYPIVTDNCSAFYNNDLTYQDDYIDLPCNSLYNGVNITARIERKWWVTDANGLTDTCVQMIYLQRAMLTDIVFPQNLDGIDQSALSCGQDPYDTNLTGVPTIFGVPIDNGDACELSVTPTDLVLNTCGINTYDVIRTWTAADWCSGSILTHAQIIKVMDTIAPVINCPADQLISASPISCGAAVTLPIATVTDNCSGVTVNSSWDYGTGTGPFYNVPVGPHLITYTAEDDCGNMSTCTITITVIDNIAPVNICKTSLTINISSGGSATVPAVTFDDGSFDNCQIDYYEAKRSGMPFGAFVTFDCNDINKGPVEITFRVFDTTGNYNDCVASVNVHDNIYPIITCGAPTYLSCGDDVSNTDLTGMPLVGDNCSIDTLYYEDDANINVCGTGNIYRTWTVVDASGHSSTCVQTLVIQDNTPIQVSFPANFSSSECGLTLVDPSVTGEPIIINDDCESVDFTFTENVFEIAAPACYTILRNWVVVDWCTYVPNSGSLDGYYTHTQVITITDNDAPVLTAPVSFTAGSLASDCGSDYIVVESATAVDCNPNVAITNNSLYAFSNGPDASGNYPLGVHVITFTANDNCGNVSTETMTLTVVDGLSPTAICLSGLALSLDTDGVVELDPNLLNASSHDNCTDAANLFLSVSPSSFDCTDVGSQLVTLTVKDEAGNISTCTSIVEVQDNQFVCGQTFSLTGQVLTWEGEVMEGTEVQIINGDTSSMYTNSAGNFLFEGAMSENNYLVKPFKNDNFSNGVSSWDLVLIGKHILGTQKLNDPYKLIAADANHSGGISTFDLVHLKKIILNIDTVLNNNTSWRFIDANFVFPNSENPFSTLFPEATFVEDISEDVSALDFMGIKVGDVNGSANPNGLLSSDGRNAEEELIFEIEEQELIADEVVDVIFQAKTPEDLMGYQFTIQLDTNLLELVEIIPGDDLKKSTVGNDDFGLRLQNKGYITTQWINIHEEELAAETEFFRLRCRAKAAGLLSRAVIIHSDITMAEAYRGDGKEKVEVMEVLSRFKSEEKANSPQLSLQNAPNPFKTYTILSIELPKASAVELIIYDQAGRQWKKMNTYYEAGQQQIRLERNDLPATGIYFCSMNLMDIGQTLIRKLMVVD